VNRDALYRAPRSRLRQWLRHHAAALVAAIVDFGFMVGCVEWLHVRAVPATIVGASCGAVTNFLIGRYWTYRRGDIAPQRQFLRYALVSAASLGLNALGEHLFVNLLHIQYVVSRVITALVVSNAWNYPMQRFFVFGERRAAE
jgi:putative flippase GtrA